MAHHQVSRVQQWVNREKGQRRKHQNLTAQAKFQLNQDKFTLNGSKTPLNASLAAAYHVDSKTVTNILAKSYDHWANLMENEPGSGFRMVRPVKSWRKDRLVSQEGKRGLDLTEIFGPVKSGPVFDWSKMGSLQASLSLLRLVADWL